MLFRCARNADCAKWLCEGEGARPSVEIRQPRAFQFVLVDRETAGVYPGATVFFFLFTAQQFVIIAQPLLSKQTSLRRRGPSQDVGNNIKPNLSNQVSLEVRLSPDTGINNRSSVGDAENPLFSSPAQSGQSPDEVHDTPITSPVSSEGGTEKKESYMSSIQGVVPSEAPDDSVIRQPFTGEGKKVYSTNHILSNLVVKLVWEVINCGAVSSLQDGTKFMCCISDITQEGEHIEGTKQIGVTRQADCVIVSWLV